METQIIWARTATGSHMVSSDSGVTWQEYQARLADFKADEIVYDSAVYLPVGISDRQLVTYVDLYLKDGSYRLFSYTKLMYRVNLGNGRITHGQKNPGKQYKERADQLEHDARLVCQLAMLEAGWIQRLDGMWTR